MRIEDNRVYRQLSGCDTLKASSRLSALRDRGLLCQRGKGSATYYVPGPLFESLNVSSSCVEEEQSRAGILQDKDGRLQDMGEGLQDKDGRLQDMGAGLQGDARVLEVLKPLKKKLKADVLDGIVVDLCRIRDFERSEIAHLIERDETYVRTILTRLVKSGRLKMKYPEMPNHPRQKYVAQSVVRETEGV